MQQVILQPKKQQHANFSFLDHHHHYGQLPSYRYQDGRGGGGGGSSRGNRARPVGPPVIPGQPKSVSRPSAPRYAREGELAEARKKVAGRRTIEFKPKSEELLGPLGALGAGAAAAMAEEVAGYLSNRVKRREQKKAEGEEDDFEIFPEVVIVVVATDDEQDLFHAIRTTQEVLSRKGSWKVHGVLEEPFVAWKRSFLVSRGVGDSAGMGEEDDETRL